MKEEKRREILENAMQIKEIMSQYEDKTMEHIQYYENFEFVGTNLQERQVYIVKLQSKKQSIKSKKNLQKNKDKQADNEEQSESKLQENEKEQGLKKDEISYEIYDKEQNLIATVGKDGKLQFTAEYKEKLKQISPEMYEMLQLEGNDFELPEELSENDMVITETDLEKFSEEKLAQENQTANRKKQAQEGKEARLEGENAKQRKGRIAKALGVGQEEIRGFAQIEPNRKIADNASLADMIPEARNYERIEIACTRSGNSKQGGSFSILGIEKDGTRKILNSVASIEGVDTNKKVISIDEKGEQIKENSVQGLMQINSKNREDGIAISLGNYGMLDISYVKDVMNKETRRSTPIDTLEAENRKTLSAEVKENAEDDIEEVREEGKNFREKEKQGKRTQTIDDIDKQRNENIETVKARIAEETAEIVNEGANKKEVRDFIESQLKSSTNLTFKGTEKEKLINQIEEEALDISRFPTKGRTQRNLNK